MLTSYLTLALRTLRRRPGYALANGAGLTLGLACGLLVALYLAHELRYDAFHPDADRVVRLWKEIEGRDDRYVLHPPQRAEAYRTRVAGIEAATAFGPNYRPTFVTVGGADRRLKHEAQTLFEVTAGDGFFDVLSGFTLVQGDPATALAAPNQIVLAEATARRYFGADYGTILGETVRLYERTLTVSGVMRVPARSHVRPDALHTVATPGGTNATHYTYLRLTEGTDPATLPTRLDAAYDALYAEGGRGFPPERLSLGVERLRSIHLHTTVARPLSPPTDVRYLWAFGALGGIVLLIAGLNYTNLAVAMLADRSREVGVRKSLGARPRQVTGQLLTEAVVLAGACVPVALALVQAVRPAFNELMGTQIAAPLTSPGAWSAAAALAGAVGLAAGAYPAFGMARRQATALFDGSAFARTGTRGGILGGLLGGGRLGARRGLIVVQFGLLIALVSGAVLVQQQLAFIQAKDLGFDRARVLQITNGNALAEQDTSGRWIAPRYDALRQRLMQTTAVENVTTLSRTPGEFWYERTFRPEGDTTQSVGAPLLYADHHVFATLGIEPAGGAYFERPVAERQDAVLLSQAFLDALPPHVLGPDGLPRALFSADGERVPVGGAFRSINFFSLRQEASPLVIVPRTEVSYPPRILVRAAPGATPAAMEAVRAAWADLAPGTPPSISFLDDQVADLYAQDRRFGTLSVALAGVAGFLAVLGLVAVTAYLTRLRLKEIGIRKALGASVGGILVLLNREFVALVAVALAVGAPLAWWGASAWLHGFAYRIEVSPLVFAAVGLGALALAVGAVTWQSLGAARVDPARVLRSE